MAKNDNLKDFLTDLADAIREKKGTSGPINPQDFTSEIASIETGSGGEGESQISDPIRFLDYDGTILYTYNWGEFLEMDGLPPLPSHDGLICQEWNYTREDILEQTLFVEVGATYITDDGSTRCVIEIKNGDSLIVSLNFYQSTGNGVSVNWGDSSLVESSESVGYITLSHTYSDYGVYTIGLMPSDGCELRLGHSSSFGLFGTNTWQDSNTYSDILLEVYIGRGVRKINNNIGYYTRLRTFCIPNTIDMSAELSFNYSLALEQLIYPRGVSTIHCAYTYSDYIISERNKVFRASIPNTVKRIWQNFDTLLTDRVIFPNSATTFTNFEGCKANITNTAGNNNAKTIDVLLNNNVFPYSSSSVTKGVIKYIIDLTRADFSRNQQSNFVIGQWCKVENNVVKTLKEITLPQGTTTLGNNFFCSCGTLQNITLNEELTTIGDYAFTNCYALPTIKTNSALVSIGSGAFMNCTGLKEVELNDGLKTLGAYAFYGCDNITSIVLPNSVSSLGDNVFYDNYSLFCIKMSKDIKSIGSGTFFNCANLKTIDMSNVEQVPTLSSTYSFNGCNKVNIYVPPLLYNDFLSATNWSSLANRIIMSYEPKVCVSLSISADNVPGNAISTQISWSAITNGFNSMSGEEVFGVELNGTVFSEPFPQNTSYTDTIERVISYTYMGVTATTTITQGVWIDQSYTLDFNDGQWELSETIPNPDSTLYDGVYQSVKSKGVDNSYDAMYIDIVGYETFKLYIRSYAESNYDYVMVSQLDQTINGSTSYSDTTLVKAYTGGNQQSGTAIGNYTLVEFTGIDSGDHRITIVYRKDSSTASGDDRGYVLIPKVQ